MQVVEAFEAGSAVAQAAGARKAVSGITCAVMQVAEAFGAGPAIAQTAGARKAAATTFVAATAPAARAASQVITEVAAATAMPTPAPAPLDMSEPVEIPDFARKSLGYISPSDEQPDAAPPMTQFPIGNVIVDPTGEAPTRSAERAGGEDNTALSLTRAALSHMVPSTVRNGLRTPIAQGRMVPSTALTGQPQGQVAGTVDPLTRITQPSSVLPTPSASAGTPSVTSVPMVAPAALPPFVGTPGVSDTPQPSLAQRAQAELAKAVETLALARNRLASLEASVKVPKVRTHPTTYPLNDLTDHRMMAAFIITQFQSRD